MTKTTENGSNNPADAAEIERLRAHSTQLLGELKAAKAKATTLQDQLTATTEQRDALQQEIRTLRLAPAHALLEQIGLPGTANMLANMLKERGYTFDLDGDEIVPRDAEGNPATVTDPPSRDNPAPKPRAARLVAADLILLMTEEGKPEAERHPLSKTFARFIVGSRASGGGASGGAGTIQQPPPSKPAAKPSAPQAFGLS